MIEQATLDLLKKHGFLWYKQKTTDRVDVNCIDNIYPAAQGFTVVYNDTAFLKASTATVRRIEMPQNLEKEWIRVHWETITDEDGNWERTRREDPKNPYDR